MLLGTFPKIHPFWKGDASLLGVTVFAKVDVYLWIRESLRLYTSSSRYQQDIDLTLCSLRGVRRTHCCATIKPVVASPLCEKWEQRTLPAFPPQIWKIAIQKVRSLAWWSETVRQHMNTPGLLNIGKGKPTKTNIFSDKFRRGRGGGGSKVSCFPMCPVLIFLFKLLKNIPWKYPFVSFLCQKSPV